MASQERRKVLVIGSGPVKIGEAAEFDYSASQALKALREEGYESIVLNSNVATVQTSHEMADKVYLLPVTAYFVEKVIQKERPWGILIGFGGQSALNIGVELSKNGTFSKYDVNVLGTAISGIEAALSRDIFRETMKQHGIPIPRSASARSRDVAMKAAESIGYPVMMRVSFNLGGRGSAVLWSEKELDAEIGRAFAQSAVGEILLEKYLFGWKEIEYEVVRDHIGNCAVTACIENLDPMGVHTGDSVSVTPAQTLDNYEFQQMRSTAIRVAEAIGLVGECNVQFALSPDSYEFYVIETNPRMSRSSALASKATGYPLAYVSAKLALKHRLYDIKNNVSKSTTAFFEPSLDYITIKMPKWNMSKFDFVSNSIGTEMKSIGEIMSIGRNFEEAMQKAVRMLDINGEDGLVGGSVYTSALKRPEIEAALKGKRPYWFLYAAKAFRDGMSIDEVYSLTQIDRFFLKKVKALVDAYEARAPDGDERYLKLKAQGFSDRQLGSESRRSITIKQIDTLAGEWPAATNYLYTTGVGGEDDIGTKTGKRKLLVLGAGVFRIGVSVEFDYGAVALARSAKKYFDEVSILNCNPETVSTDWDRVDKLYFDELTEETITNIHAKEGFESVATFTGGQIGNNLSVALEKRGMKLFGTAAKSIDSAENRDSFSKLLERLNIRQADWTSAASYSDIKAFIERFGFPVIIRPSYVISGSAMKIANNMDELESYLKAATRLSRKHPSVISSFIGEGIETELDCASDGKSVIGVPLCHIEEAGVHSGDATMMTPYLDGDSSSRMKEIALVLANELSIKGPFNIQFIVKNNEALVIELNLRASRSMPFSSKATGISLMDHAVSGIMGRFEWNGFREPEHGAFAVKSSQFSWGQLKGAYPFLGPEMRSTGESASFGKTLGSALVKSWLGAQPNAIPKKAALVYGNTDRGILKEAADALARNISVYTLDSAPMHNHHTVDADKALRLMDSRGIDMVVTNSDLRGIDYHIRRRAVDMNIPLVLNARLGRALAESMFDSEMDCLEMREYWTGK
ncbi:MAG: carbamoyl-phosphate synthase (glutamine-hydrolyzing) large subunit [Candidatus Marsarchaeota archaeon]|nr:carbamoyl-phosphate synthase (glutamine-hydrolyzing) large subunit [Candidatus Marsarchaeota archaeon]